MKRDWLVKVTVNNAGLDFDDDVDFVQLTTDGSVTKFELEEIFIQTDKLLRKEDENDECEYNDFGWNASTLLDKICDSRGWTWEFVAPEIDFVIG
jgi:hypothetical protein